MGRIAPRTSWQVALQTLVAAAVALAASAGRAAEPPPRVHFDSQLGEVVIQVAGQDVATYVYADPKIRRPYLAHVRAPGGVQVTRTHPPVQGTDPTDHATMHPGIWMAFGDLSGHDFWRNKGRIASHRVSVQASGPGRGVLHALRAYHAPGSLRKALGTEDWTLTFLVRPAGYLLIWTSTFRAAREPMVFGDQEEMGLGVRVATPLTEENGGRILDARGRTGARQVWGHAAKWCDYSGTLDGTPAGVTLMCAPDNFRPSWFHARDYGLLVANPFGRKAMRKGRPSKVVVTPGKPLTLRYGILLHAGKEPDLDAAYRDFLEQLKQAGD
ncbi:MAG: PmoA family protein [Planctomycetota bacterium]